MKDNKKLIVVIYVGSENKEPHIMYQTISDIQKSISQYFDKSVKLLFIPDYTNIGIKVDCINPVLLDEEEFKKVDEKLSKINNLIDEYLNGKEK